MSPQPVQIDQPKGKLGVLIPGMGAVATTFIAGVEAIRRRLALPIGSLTQMGTIRLGKRTDKRTPLIKDFVPLAGIEDLVFGGWDLFKDNAYEAAMKAGVLDPALLGSIKNFLTRIRPIPAVFEQRFVKNLHGENVKKGKTKMDLAEQVMDAASITPEEEIGADETTPEEEEGLAVFRDFVESLDLDDLTDK